MLNKILDQFNSYRLKKSNPLDRIVARRFTAEEKYNWLKGQNTKIKKYLSKWFIDEFFDESVEKLMTLQQDDREAFRKWYY
jgi:benzoyl-CoA reductase/2-hydroxyglutaryl-CoA dehydratase subunit BcrC/BadD/HgdB